MTNTFINPEDFIDKDIFSLLGLENIPQEKKDEMTGQMTRTIQNRVLARILDGLQDQEIKEFEGVVDLGDEHKIQQFLSMHKLDLTQIVGEEALNYKAEMINLIKK